MKTYFAITGIVENKNKVLILKKSAKDYNYPKRWSFCSGYVKEFESAEDTVLREIKEETGLKARIVKNVYSHSFRHAFGTHSIQDGEDIVSLQEMMGHSSLDTTRLYITLSKKHVRGKKTPLDRLEDN